MPARELTELVDKSEWGDGPWQSEPDKVEWTDAATGLPCLIVRHLFGGHLCGYAGVPEGHPLFGCDRGDERTQKALGELPGHAGGVNYSNLCQDAGDEPRVCHTPTPGEPDRVWWFGFDCGHIFDFCPGYESRLAGLLRQSARRPTILRETYRTVEYVREECAELARQLASVKPPSSTPSD